MIRAVPGIRRDPLAFLARTVARYGDLVAFPMPRTPVLLVNTPTAAHRVLVANHRGYTKHTAQYSSLAMVTGQGLLTSDGEIWRRSRRIAQPAFHRSTLDVVARAAVSAAASLQTTWTAAPGGVVDVEQACLSATMSVIGRTLFGSDLHGRGEDLIRAVLDALDVVVRRVRTPAPVPAWLPTPGNRALARANSALDGASARLVAERRSAAGQRDDDLLGLLLAAVGEELIEARQLRDELVTMVIAGHETVATSLAWTLHLLATHPEAQQRLHHELDDVVGAAGAGRDPAWADLGDLPWTRAVVDESLRLYPPAWVVSRKAVADDVLDEIPVPAGTLVIISPWLLHRREQDWARPDVFDPTRFVGRADRAAGGSYLPFGAGPRLCIGRDFALVESVLMLATLLRRHRVEPAGSGDGSVVEVDALVTMRPRGGLPLRLRSR
jgi:cytochrome P450